MGQEVAFIVLITLSVMIFFQLLITKAEVRKNLDAIQDDLIALRKKIECD
jgi:hypothetical protein